METTNTTTTAGATVHGAELSKATTQAVQAAISERVDINHFRPYDSSLPVPDLAGYRTVKCLYKTNKATGKAAGENSYIRIPDYITEEAVSNKVAQFMPFFIGYLQAQEDEIVKGMHKEGAQEITAGTLSLDALLEHLESSATSQRMNGERIAQWFVDNMRDPLTLAFAEKMGLGEEPTDAEMKKLTAILEAYEGKYKSLASGKTVYRKEEAEVLQRALEVTGAEKTMVGARFHARLEQMKTVRSNDLLMAL